MLGARPGQPSPSVAPRPHLPIVTEHPREVLTGGAQVTCSFVNEPWPEGCMLGTLGEPVPGEPRDPCAEPDAVCTGPGAPARAPRPVPWDRQMPLSSAPQGISPSTPGTEETGSGRAGSWPAGSTAPASSAVPFPPPPCRAYVGCKHSVFTPKSSGTPSCPQACRWWAGDRHTKGRALWETGTLGSGLPETGTLGSGFASVLPRCSQSCARTESLCMWTHVRHSGGPQDAPWGHLPLTFLLPLQARAASGVPMPPLGETQAWAA